MGGSKNAVRMVGAVAGLVVLAGVATWRWQRGEGVQRLTAGQPIERSIGGLDVHRYSVELASGEFLRAVLDQRGIDVVVTVYEPSAGRVLARVDSPNGANGPEPIVIATASQGDYRIEVRSLSDSTPAGRYELRIEELLTRDAYRARLEAERAVALATRQWAGANAIRLTTVEPGRGFEDMQPLRPLVGDARIVALGEATHGTREFFQLKHRVLEYLVSEMGFDVFAIEATMPESFDVGSYVLGGEGDARQALAGIYFWTWDTEEVLEMIEWMRRYNADPRHLRKVKFYGFDMQAPSRAARVVVDYLGQVEPARAEAARNSLRVLANPYTAAEFYRAEGARVSALAKETRELLARFDQERSAYVGRSSAAEWSLARQHVVVLTQYLERSLQPFLSRESSAVRDRAMAANVAWILEREGPDSKAVLWAHNSHVSVGDATSMGAHLRKTFGPSMVVAGLAFNDGGFQAIEAPIPSRTGLRVFGVAPGAEGSLDAMLAAAGLGVAALDLRSLPTDGPVAEWFRKPRASRTVGAVYSEANAALYWLDVTPASFDAILFVDRTTPARPLRRADAPGRPQQLAFAANLDFEDGALADAPVDWTMAAKLSRHGFDVMTSEERPYSGAHCARIERGAGRHYGEVAGALTQRIDAAVFRGRRVRLRAAARAEVVGSESGSWLRLTISRDRLGPQATVFDSLDQYAVSSPEWKVLEIAADVPADADSISYGLALVGEGTAWLDAVEVDAVD